MPENRKKVTRPMNVTIYEDELEKLEKGITHSNNGIRNADGSISTNVDIAPLSEEDLPVRETVRTEYIAPESEEPSFAATIANALVEIFATVLSDPEIQEGIVTLAKGFWHYKVMPKIHSGVQKMRDGLSRETKESKPLANEEVSYQLEVADRTSRERFVVTEEQANLLVEETRKKARELAGMIYILSNISVKDEKTEAEYTLEQSYIKQLVSDEATATMRFFTEHHQLIDSDTAQCFSDFLSGYIRNGDRLIAVPMSREEYNVF